MKKKTKNILNIIFAIFIICFIIFFGFAIIGSIVTSLPNIHKAESLCKANNADYVKYESDGGFFQSNNFKYAECDYLNCDGKKICIKERIVIKP